MRESLTENQKLIVDELDFVKAMQRYYKGMYYLTVALRNKGIIKDHIKQYDDGELTQNIRENHYNQRFGFFKSVQFPRYKTYKQYIDQTPKDPLD